MNLPLFLDTTIRLYMLYVVFVWKTFFELSLFFCYDVFLACLHYSTVYQNVINSIMHKRYRFRKEETGNLQEAKTNAANINSNWVTESW